jgi:methyl-accepting chemotaxis protein
MTNYEALSIANAIALMANALAFGALWRALRDSRWAHVGLTALVVSLFYVVDSRSTPTAQPSLSGIVVGASAITVILVGISRHLELARQAIRASAAVLVLMACAVMLFAALRGIERLPLFVVYSAMFVTELITALVGLESAHRRRFVAVLISLAAYPAMVSTIALADLDPRYLRYVTGLVVFLSCMAMLIEGMLRTNERTGSALDDLREARGRLESVVQAMADGSQKVAGAGESVSQSAQLLAMRTDEQTESLRTISETVHSVVAQVQHTAANVAAVDTQCEHLREQARQGDVVVNDAVEAINLINQRALEMSEAVALIQAIAFQTNILALNAAVEAARAGEAGRGFAVVAAEVRSLSMRTTESARHVKDLIERAGSQASAGVDKVQGVKQQLYAMIEAVEQVAARTGEVSADARVQSESLEQVMLSVDALTRLTDANAQLVAESVLAADGMNDSAGELRAMVAQVQMDDDVARALPVAEATKVAAGVDFF